MRARLKAALAHVAGAASVVLGFTGLMLAAHGAPWLGLGTIVVGLTCAILADAQEP